MGFESQMGTVGEENIQINLMSSEVQNLFGI